MRTTLFRITKRGEVHLFLTRNDAELAQQRIMATAQVSKNVAAPEQSAPIVEEVLFDSLSNEEVQQTRCLLFAGFCPAASAVFKISHAEERDLYVELFGSGTSIERFCEVGGPVWDLFSTWFEDVTSKGGQLSMPSACEAGSKLATERLSNARMAARWKERTRVAEKLGISNTTLSQLLVGCQSSYPEVMESAADLKRFSQNAGMPFPAVCELLHLGHRTLKRACEHHRRLAAIRSCVPTDWQLSASLVRALARIPTDAELTWFVTKLDRTTQPSGPELEEAITVALQNGSIAPSRKGRKKDARAKAAAALAAAIKTVREWQPDFEGLDALEEALRTITDSPEGTLIKFEESETSKYGCA